MKNIVLVLCVLTSLLACKNRNPTKSLEQQPVVEEVVGPKEPNPDMVSDTQIEIPDTELGFLVTYQGKYAGQERLFENAVLASRLENLERFNYEVFLKLWNTETPIVIENGILHMSGCKAHDCPGNAYDFFVDLENDNINIFHFRSNMLKIYQEKGWIELPEGFAKEMEIKKGNAGIGITSSTESNYKLTTD